LTFSCGIIGGKGISGEEHPSVSKWASSVQCLLFCLVSCAPSGMSCHIYLTIKAGLFCKNTSYRKWNSMEQDSFQSIAWGQEWHIMQGASHDPVFRWLVIIIIVNKNEQETYIINCTGKLQDTKTDINVTIFKAKYK